MEYKKFEFKKNNKNSNNFFHIGDYVGFKKLFKGKEAKIYGTYSNYGYVVDFIDGSGKHVVFEDDMYLLPLRRKVIVEKNSSYRLRKFLFELNNDGTIKMK